jgi:hypothetical protein
MNKYLDYIPIEKSNPKRMAYGQSLPDDEIRSIMGEIHSTGMDSKFVVYGQRALEVQRFG